MIDQLQFYKTPRHLAERLWSMAKETHYRAILDACAGEGDLADAMPRGWREERAAKRVDCIEIDASKHPALRAKGFRVVGLDFLGFEGGSVYQLVVLNPPFASGAKHVLKAWDSLFCGEVLAIINAETLRNPFSAERQRLATLVRDHGQVVFVDDAFRGDDVEREANVDVALIHLDKPAECNHDWIGPVIDAMAQDGEKHDTYELPTELALPASFVETQVRAFNLAVKAMRDSVRMQAVAKHYAIRIGATLDQRVNRQEDELPPAIAIREQLADEYDKLKDRAWASVLRSTDALNKLSSKVQRQAESRFAEIQALEFSASNVYGFLLGLVESQPEMMLDMACDVFDQITRYWSDNTVYYKGWKSNDRHRTMGFRIKTTRFVLPNNRSWSHALDYDAVRRLADLDKVFAMLDGKASPEVSLVSLFEPARGGRDPGSFSKLRHGERLSGSYLDVRYYPGVGTIHFFPRSKELVDRLNRLVGRRRGWLPPTEDQVAKEFWVQFDKAEKFDRELRAECDKQINTAGRFRHRSDHPMEQYMSSDAQVVERGGLNLARAMDTVLERHGLLQALNHTATGDPLLLAA